MDEKRVTTKAELMQHIERDWERLSALLDKLSPFQFTEIKNAEGWTVKDHVAHMAAWEKSAIAFLQSIPRHRGLGVPEDIYSSRDVERINADIYQTHADDPPEVVRARLIDTHQQMLQILSRLTDEDLMKPYSDYLPDERRDGEGPPAINFIYGATAHHFRTHQRWIEEMLAAHADSNGG